MKRTEHDSLKNKNKDAGKQRRNATDLEMSEVGLSCIIPIPRLLFFLLLLLLPKHKLTSGLLSWVRSPRHRDDGSHTARCFLVATRGIFSCLDVFSGLFFRDSGHDRSQAWMLADTLPDKQIFSGSCLATVRLCLWNGPWVLSPPLTVSCLHSQFGDDKRLQPLWLKVT